MDNPLLKKLTFTIKDLILYLFCMVGLGSMIFYIDDSIGWIIIISCYILLIVKVAAFLRRKEKKPEQKEKEI